MGCVTSSIIPSSSPAPDAVPETTAKKPTTAQHTTMSWKIIPTSQTQAYSSHLTTVVTQTDTPISRHDSLAIQALYSIHTTRDSDSLFFSGSITSFIIQGTTLESLETQPVFPVVFTGKIANNTISTELSDNRFAGSTRCADASRSLLTIVQRNLFLLPLEITEQQAWTDTTSSTVCSGTLPFTLTSILTFHVIGESEFDGSPALVLDQSERTFSKGEGPQGQHRILVEAEGLTTGRIYIDRTSGQLLGTNLTNKTSLLIHSSGQVHHFFQNSTETTKRINN
jgi:hypothetical protein